MSQTIATVHNGYVKVPSNWPDGTEVKLYKVDQATNDNMSQEEIERVIKARQVLLDQGYDQQADEELQSIINARRAKAKAEAFLRMERLKWD
jgi:hypothetical protein